MSLTEKRALLTKLKGDHPDYGRVKLAQLMLKERPDLFPSQSAAESFVKRQPKTPFEVHCLDRGVDPASVPYYWDKTQQYSLLVRPNEVADSASIENMLAGMFSRFQQYKPKYAPIELAPVDDPHLLVVDVADAHFGKLASAYETGETYNIEVAKHRVMEGVRGVVSKAVSFNIERVMLVVGNDVLHFDNSSRTTTSGTRQDSDVMFYDMFNAALETFVEVIEWLMKQYHVDIVFNPSNHDYLGGWMFARALSCWFRGADNVTIDDSIAHRKYHVYGVNLIATSHGDGAKMENMPLLMANERPKMWAETVYRYVYLHHIHHKQRNHFQSGKDYIGVTVEYLRSPSAPDSWHNRKGFVGAKKAVEGFIHHRENGQIARLTHYF